MTDSEQFVYGLCRGTFLRLWSYANPRRHASNHELCDILVVCDPDVVIVSVKEVRLPDPPVTAVHWARWAKKAVDESAEQIYGAERDLARATCVTRSDGTYGVPLPPAERRKVHRIAVAFGGRRTRPIRFDNGERGFVHVLDEPAVWTLLGELDTVSDLVQYLTARESLQARGSRVGMASEEDLMALYLANERRFPVSGIASSRGLWKELQDNLSYKAKRKADAVSLLWDGLIEGVAKEQLAGHLEYDSDMSGDNMALRTMARENRLSRRILGQAWHEFLQLSRAHPRARCCPSPSGIVYVFLAFPRAADRSRRRDDLGKRCLAALGRFPEACTVVGIATEQYSPEGFSLDFHVLHVPETDTATHAAARELQRMTGYFVNAVVSQSTEDEYPSPLARCLRSHPLIS